MLVLKSVASIFVHKYSFDNLTQSRVCCTAVLVTRIHDIKAFQQYAFLLPALVFIYRGSMAVGG